MTPEGFQARSSASTAQAVKLVLHMLYQGIPLPSAPVTDYVPSDEYRDNDIYRRYQNGEPVASIAARVGLSLQRVYMIIRQRK